VNGKRISKQDFLPGSPEELEHRLSVIDPLQRRREHGEKPDFAGLPSFAGAPLSSADRIVREVLTGVGLRRLGDASV